MILLNVWIKSEKKTLTNNKKHIIFLTIGIIIVISMTYFNPVINSFSIKYKNLNLLLIVYIFIAGMIAISAMVLPGISGSTILLIFGLYAPILNSIKEILKLNLKYLPGVLIFGCGVVLGIVLTVRSVRHLLKNFRSQTIYLIIGLMIGSIYSVIMGPTSLEVPKSQMSISTFSLIFFIIGCTLVPALEKLKSLLKNKEISSQSV